MNAADAERLRGDYVARSAIAHRLLACLREQLSTLVAQNDVSLAVPMEGRVKSLESIKDKLERKPSESVDLSALNDLVGMRLILLFQPDLEIMDKLLHRSLDVQSSENTGARLTESQFGYQSNHYVVRIPESWQEIPSYSDLGGLVAEIQVRTLAQHMWAAASHVLQYKHETSVPLPLRRTIHRVSALLETVDLEFSRVLVERSSYIEESVQNPKDNELNVDILANILSEVFPPENRKEEGEPYDSLLTELREAGFASAADLRELFVRHREEMVKQDLTIVSNKLKSEDYTGTTPERIKKGVYFSHVGLGRGALRAEQTSKPPTMPKRTRAKAGAGRKRQPSKARIAGAAK